jgi:hypothetical protein
VEKLAEGVADFLEQVVEQHRDGLSCRARLVGVETWSAHRAEGGLHANYRIGAGERGVSGVTDEMQERFGGSWGVGSGDAGSADREAKSREQGELENACQAMHAMRFLWP